MSNLYTGSLFIEAVFVYIGPSQHDPAQHREFVQKAPGYGSIENYGNETIDLLMLLWKTGNH